MRILEKLRQKIASKEARLAVIGLGYVGLPVACIFAEAGFDVVGIDIQANRVDTINGGILPLEGKEPGLAQLLVEVVKSGNMRAETSYDRLKDRDIILIAVETPVDEHHNPRYDALRSVLRSLGPVLKLGGLVIVESTLAPRTMTDVVQPLLEQKCGGKLNQDFFLGHCPERVMPGKLLANLQGVSRIVGGMTAETAETMLALYRWVVKADLDPADCLTAELTKTMENAYRDVQIAFANEMALLCENLGADVWQIREFVNKSPGRQMHFPGGGVGGHCIPKDPWLLVANADENFEPRLISTSRQINDAMPLHMVDLTISALREVNLKISEARIAVLGYAYLPNSDDTRNSPSQVLVDRLRSLGAKIVIHDPWVPEFRGDLKEAIRGCDALILMVAHDEYRQLDWAELVSHLRHPVLVDGRNMIDEKQNSLKDTHFRQIGKGDLHLSKSR